jgi:DNA-binding CsgD family transcriptional regulator
MLSRSDVASLLAAVAELSSSVDPETLADRMPSAVAKVFDCEMVSFDNFSNDRDHAYIETQWHNNTDILTPSVIEVFSEVYNTWPEEHPLAFEILHRGNNIPLRMSDCVSNSKFRNKAIFSEFFRRIGIAYQLGIAMPVSKELTVSCALNRASKDFSEKDKVMLGLLTPHLINSIRNSLFVREMRQRALRLEKMLASVSRGVIRVGADRSLLEISEPATRNLLKYFPSWKAGSGRLPERMHAWLMVNCESNSDQLLDLHKPFIVMRDGGMLRVVAVRDAVGEVTLLMEERGRIAADSLASTGLTKRESEILLHIESGKSDAAVATLCGISKRTVQKHVENIFKKLNVETRTAAVRRVFDSIEDQL